MEQRVWTISNILSALRIVLVIPITICLVSEFPYHRYYAAGLVLLAIATDFFDGYLARQFHQVSELGKILDP
ncbi:MAG: CDP-alcohol phosphatidyltransferase family protein, partial [Bacteroidetes bacterium]|nr:CDP-alcohol phosphatidyltransferase family protein [Bacteroidota bacterium]